MTRRSARAQLACAFAMLLATLWWRTPLRWQDEWGQETTRLVFNSVYQKATRGLATPMANPNFEGLSRDEARDAWHTPTGVPYLKQVGLQAFALALLVPRQPDAMRRALEAARYVSAFLTAGVLTLLVGNLAERCGWRVGWSLVAFLVLNTATSFGIFVGHSLYWLPFLSLLPLLLVLSRYRPDIPPEARRSLLALVLLAVFLKALCGYEHISTVVLAPAAVVALSIGRAPRRLLVRHGLELVIAGGMGVVVAILLHFALLYGTSGSADEALRNTVVNAVQRSFGGDTSLHVPQNLRMHLLGIYGTLAQNKAVTVLIALWVLVAAAVVARAGRRRLGGAGALELRALLVASGIALAASLSWLVLMRTHAIMAPAVNGLVFTQSFVWFAVPFIVSAVESFVPDLLRYRPASRADAQGNARQRDVAGRDADGGLV